MPSDTIMSFKVLSSFIGMSVIAAGFVVIGMWIGTCSDSYVSIADLFTEYSNPFGDYSKVPFFETAGVFLTFNVVNIYGALWFTYRSRFRKTIYHNWVFLFFVVFDTVANVYFILLDDISAVLPWS
jgi:hypothetical protein